jgi:gluconate 5-dehydrogenase
VILGGVAPLRSRRPRGDALYRPAMSAPAPSPFDIAGRTALVTGSSRGIGRALAAGLLAAGARVVLNGVDAARLADAAARLRDEVGGTVHAVPFDVTRADDVARGVAEAEDRVGPLDILVNNAGMQFRSPLTEFPDDAWDRLLALNLTGPFLVGREVARRMLPRGRGKIVNVGSLQSEVVRPGIAPYSATKGGLKMLTKGMCADLAGHGIQVNALGPGYVVTELTRALHEDPEFDAWVRRRTPAARWGRVEDLVGTLVYLVSPASDFVNGQIIYVDGGMLSVL